MATFKKKILSGSTNGRPIKVLGTAATGTIIHTASTSIDEVWIWAHNSSASSQNVVVEYGGTTDPDDTITVSVDADAGLQEIIPGLPLSGSLVVRMYSTVSETINVVGFVNRVVT